MKLIELVETQREEPDFSVATNEELEEAITTYLVEHFLPRIRNRGVQPDRGFAVSS